jgi:hypothetical protein
MNPDKAIEHMDLRIPLERDLIDAAEKFLRDGGAFITVNVAFRADNGADGSIGYTRRKGLP